MSVHGPRLKVAPRIWCLECMYLFTWQLRVVLFPRSSPEFVLYIYAGFGIQPFASKPDHVPPPLCESLDGALVHFPLTFPRHAINLTFFRS